MQTSMTVMEFSYPTIIRDMKETGEMEKDTDKAGESTLTAKYTKELGYMAVEKAKAFLR